MSDRQRVSPKMMALNADHEGAYTYNLFPPDDYEGRIVVFAVCGLGDHAHIQVSTGRQLIGGDGEPYQNHGVAGNLVMAWGDWVALRDALEGFDFSRIAEVRRASRGQLAHHFAKMRP